MITSWMRVPSMKGRKVSNFLSFDILSSFCHLLVFLSVAQTHLWLIEVSLYDEALSDSTSTSTSGSANLIDPLLISWLVNEWGSIKLCIIDNCLKFFYDQGSAHYWQPINIQSLFSIRTGESYKLNSAVNHIEHYSKRAGRGVLEEFSHQAHHGTTCPPPSSFSPLPHPFLTSVWEADFLLKTRTSGITGAAESENQI